MKMIKSLSLAVLLTVLFGASALAATTPKTPQSEKQELRAEVLQLIETGDILELDAKARISFMVTSQDEIVVLNVDTDDSYAEQVVKRKLNYKKVKTELSKKNQIYFMDVTFNIE